MPQAAVAAEAHRNRDITLEDAVAALPPDYTGTLAEIAQKIGLGAADDAAGVRLSPRDTKRLAATLRVTGRSPIQIKTGGVNRRVWSTS